VNVHGYNDSVGAARCKTVSAVVAYDHPVTGDSYMLVIHQAILIPGLKTNLLSPMQMRDFDIRVNDEPKHMVPTPTNDHHAIITPNVGGKASLRIPLSLHGVTAYFPTRKPEWQEYEQCEEELCIKLTAETLEWDPQATRFQEQEAAMIDEKESLRVNLDNDVSDRRRMVSAIYVMGQDH